MRQSSKSTISFASGDRLDFVPYISKEMIDRALDIARSVVKSSL
jgi:hypothetical protein